MDRPVKSHRHSSPASAAGTVIAAAALALAASPAGALERTADQIVKSHCATCHEAGTAGAPRPGDRGAWAPRFSRGVDMLVLSAVRGHGGMPPRGGKADLTDAELRSAVLHLFNPAGPPKETPKVAKAPVAPGTGPHRMTTGGLDVYLGLVSAERMRAFPAGSPESKLHGGVPAGTGYHHVNVSVFDTISQAPVPGASVELDVEQVGLGRETKTLEAVTVTGGPSHGAYVRLAPKGNYVFVVRVRKPGSPAAVEVKFRERIG